MDRRRYLALLGSASVAGCNMIPDGESGNPTDDVTLSALSLDRAPPVVTQRELAFTLVRLDETATLFGAPQSASVLVELERSASDDAAAVSLDRIKCTLETQSGDTEAEWSRQLTGSITAGTYTIREQLSPSRSGILAGPPDPGSYTLSVEVQTDRATVGYDYQTLGRDEIELDVLANSADLGSELRSRRDGSSPSGSVIGNPYAVSLEESHPAIRVTENTLRMLVTLTTEESLPSFGIDRATVNDLATNTAAATLTAEDGEVTVHWENRGRMADQGTNALQVWYDRAVVTATIPAPVTVLDAGGADYQVDLAEAPDADGDGTVLAWVTTDVGKGIQSEHWTSGAVDTDDPTGQHSFQLGTGGEQTAIDVEYTVQLQLGPLDERSTEQLPYAVPMESSIAEVDGVYDYERWLTDPYDAHWMSIGLVTGSERVSVPVRDDEPPGDEDDSNGGEDVSNGSIQFLDRGGVERLHPRLHDVEVTRHSYVPSFELDREYPFGSERPYAIGVTDVETGDAMTVTPVSHGSGVETDLFSLRIYDGNGEIGPSGVSNETPIIWPIGRDREQIEVSVTGDTDMFAGGVFGTYRFRLLDGDRVVGSTAERVIGTGYPGSITVRESGDEVRISFDRHETVGDDWRMELAIHDDERSREAYETTMGVSADGTSFVERIPADQFPDGDWEVWLSLYPPGSDLECLFVSGPAQVGGGRG